MRLNHGEGNMNRTALNRHAIAYDKTCSHCGETFTRQYNLLRHKRRKHPETMKRMDFQTLAHLAKSKADDQSETNSIASNDNDDNELQGFDETVHDDEKSDAHSEEDKDDQSDNETGKNDDNEEEDNDDEDNHESEEEESEDDDNKDHEYDTNWKTTNKDEKKGYKKDVFGYRKTNGTSKDDESDPFWDLLRDRVINSEETIEKFEKHVEKNKENEDWSERRIMRRAWKKTLPTVHRQLEYDLESFWILHELANKDKTFQKMVATKRKLVTSENFEPEEAIRYTIKKTVFNSRGNYDP